MKVLSIPLAALVVVNALHGLPRPDLLALAESNLDAGENASLPSDYQIALETFKAALRREAGKGARACGTLVLGDDPKEVMSCGIEELSHRRPFWLVIQNNGVDATTWTGLLQNGAGHTYRITAMADPWSYRQALLHPSKVKCHVLTLDVEQRSETVPFECFTSSKPNGHKEN